jgi:hypothetical protein
MARLTFPAGPAGLWVPVLVNLDETVLRPLHAAGQPTPPPVTARGLIDTGSDLSAVSLAILQQLGAVALGPVSSQGLTGPVRTPTYPVSSHILDFQNPSGPWLSHDRLRVMGLPLGPGFDVLIAMDVLLNCKLLLDGPGREFTLEF